MSAFFNSMYVMKTKMSTFYIIAHEIDTMRGPLFAVNAVTEKEARAKLRFKLAMGRCPNHTKVVDLFTI